ncbi:MULTISPECIES: TrkH family potassium uptake protein [Enterococcus]|uniref:TrkH family potassium uptake protein n=1 Tax=Enterococcus TaxID=1350 RepID=UPI0006880563|nr:TrkH family potassium uptake protein [Enterococcus sulfureus]
MLVHSLRKKRRPFHFSPAEIITGTFIGLILLGTGLLMLPISNQQDSPQWIDALFIATSAICVTGLSPLLIDQQFSLFGQSVILMLIEIGGLGFMSIPIFIYFVGKKRIHLSTRLVLRESMNMESRSGEVKLALAILKIAGSIQLVGIGLLAIRFIPKYGVATGIWYSVFHAISSFCNAGFDLFGTSMVAFKGDPIIILTISFLIISGGLGFLVWTDLLQIRHKKLSLHSRLALKMTGILLLVGWGLFYLIMPKTSLGKSLLDSFFLSVTPRTAGFFTLDYANMPQAGLMLTMMLMFIGGTSGSTAGGLKTTTLAVLIAKVRSLFKGRTRTEISGRTIREVAVAKAMTLFFLALAICTISLFILTITETTSNETLVVLGFEVVSAFGTVGLTMGATSSLSLVGKLVIISLMFIGRVGILTILYSLSRKIYQQEVKIKYPEESVLLG